MEKQISSPRIIFYYSLVDMGILEWSPAPTVNESSLLSKAKELFGEEFVLGWHKLKGLVAVSKPREKSGTA